MLCWFGLCWVVLSCFTLLYVVLGCVVLGCVELFHAAICCVGLSELGGVALSCFSLL